MLEGDKLFVYARLHMRRRWIEHRRHALNFLTVLLVSFQIFFSPHT